MSARERLTQLIDHASSSAPEERGKLAMELAEVLVDWPEDYPPPMRASFALLLEKITGQLDCNARKDLAAWLAPHATVPLSLLNELFFDSSRELRDTILARNAQENSQGEFAHAPVDESSLVRAAREYPPETFVQTFARLLGISATTAGRAVSDSSGEGLTILCKGAHVSRATFSTIAVLTDASLDSAERKLELYETVEEGAAAHLVQFWRARRGAGSVRSVSTEAA